MVESPVLRMSAFVDCGSRSIVIRAPYNIRQIAIRGLIYEGSSQTCTQYHHLFLLKGEMNNG